MQSLLHPSLPSYICGLDKPSLLFFFLFFFFSFYLKKIRKLSILLLLFCITRNDVKLTRKLPAETARMDTTCIRM